MKGKSGNERKMPYVTRGSVLDDLGFSPSEALELKVKAEIYHELLDYIRERGYAQQELGELLGIHQPDVSNLLNGRVSKFSVGKLIKFAGKLNLGAQVKLTKPKVGTVATVTASTRQRKRASGTA